MTDKTQMPTLFASALETTGAVLPHAVSLYYDFAGAIDTIYASLAAWQGAARVSDAPHPPCASLA